MRQAQTRRQTEGQRGESNRRKGEREANNKSKAAAAHEAARSLRGLVVQRLDLADELRDHGRGDGALELGHLLALGEGELERRRETLRAVGAESRGRGAYDGGHGADAELLSALAALVNVVGGECDAACARDGLLEHGAEHATRTTPRRREVDDHGLRVRRLLHELRPVRVRARHGRVQPLHTRRTEGDTETETRDRGRDREQQRQRQRRGTSRGGSR